MDGLRQILRGLFKKIVIADNCAEFANVIFVNPDQHSASALFLGALFFTFQIYCDFSGYSDIALGTARLFGVELLRNFAYPYFSRDIAEFWRRWHISLSSWFRDYLYIPLGGSRGGMWMKIRNTFIIFIVSGFWHGANWTFIMWGFLNALFIMPSIVFGTNRDNLETVAMGRTWPSLRELWSMIITFLLTVLAWIFFRSESITFAFNYIRKIFSRSFFEIPYFSGITNAVPIIAIIMAFLLVEWRGRESKYAIADFAIQWPTYRRWAAYFVIILSIIILTGKEQQFIYFEF